MAEDSAGRKGEDGRDEPALAPEAGMPERVNALVQEDQPPGTDPAVDGLLREPEAKQLPPRDHPELPFRNPRNNRIDWAPLTSHGEGERRPPEFLAPLRCEFLAGGRY